LRRGGRHDRGVRMRERIDLEAPLSGDFQAVVRLIIGGIAERVDFAFEEIDDLQLAVERLLAEAGTIGSVQLSFEVGTDGIRTRVGPLSEHKVAEALRDGDAIPGELTLRRILQTVVDSFGVDEADDGRIVVRLEKVKGIA
jgi:anti-sigma regulatory factor (Ser/Thr protein kinase)